MNYENITQTITDYLAKYPDSKIALTDSIENEVIACYNDSMLFDAISLKILSGDAVIKQILHTKDLSKMYNKTEDIIYLLTEEQEAIHKCKRCNEIYGEYSKNENKSSVEGYCDDCCKLSDSYNKSDCCNHFCSNCV